MPRRSRNGYPLLQGFAGMRASTWPSWAGIGMGVVATAFGKVLWLLDPAGFAASPAGWFILGGAVLLATGLLGLQLSYNGVAAIDDAARVPRPTVE